VNRGSNTGKPRRNALGPLSFFFEDEAVTSLTVSGQDEMVIHRGVESSLEPRPFDSTRHNSLARKLAQSLGQPLGGGRSRAEGYLGDGLKVTVFDAETVDPGPVIVVRRLPTLATDLNEMVKEQQVALRAVELLHHCVQARCNILIVGPARGVRQGLLAGMAAFWSAKSQIVAIKHPFATSQSNGRIVYLDGDNGVEAVSAVLGDVIVVDEPAARDWAPLLLKEQAFLGTLESSSMSLGIRRLLSQITYERPGMVMTGVEALLTSTIDLIVHCDEHRLLGLGELQHWGSQLAVRTLGKWKDDQFLLDLTESTLRKRLKEAIPGLTVDGMQLGNDESSENVGAPLGIAPVVTATKDRRVSQSFMIDNDERSIASMSGIENETASPDEAPPENVAETSIKIPASEFTEALFEPDADATSILVEGASNHQSPGELNSEAELQDVSDDDLELGTDLLGHESDSFEDEMPSVAYSLRLSEEDEESIEAQDAFSLDSPFDEPTPAVVIDHDHEPRRLDEEEPVESQATMIISKGDADAQRFAPSSDDVKPGRGRANARYGRPKSRTRRRK
jgi:hypothetical protein